MGSIALEEYDLLGDSKYRSYMTAVDRALKGFESTAEWADLIAALTKLNRVLVTHTKFPVVPRRVVISKRLAQCMHPALPSGVHQKALETYDIIFRSMGTDRLAAELFIYSAGLFPLLANAALTVRSALLTVYETHFVPLGRRLRPGLNGFLAGVLPGLEEGSDHYERTGRLLAAAAEAVGPVVFYSGLWECVATNATVRLPALTLVLGQGSRRGQGAHRGQAGGLPAHLLGSDHDVMCRALCLALRDSSALVQRAALDLLLIGFPLHQPQFAGPDMVGLVTSVLATLLRRDMSLNRRLFNWLLGADTRPELLPADHPVARADSYFLAFSQDLVVAAVVAVLEEALPCGPEQAVDTRAYRVVTSLLDKPEIGPAIIDRISLDIFRSLHHMFAHQAAHPQGPGPSRLELVKTANLLFGQLETSFVWVALGLHFTEAAASGATAGAGQGGGSEVASVGAGPAGLLEVCSLVTFLLEVVSIETYVETGAEHLPRLGQSMLRGLLAGLAWVAPHELATCLTCLRRVLARVQPAWDVWEVGPGRQEEAATSPAPEVPTAREATESGPSSPSSPPGAPTSPRPPALRQEGGQHEERVAGCRRLYTELFLRTVEDRLVATPREEWGGVLEAGAQGEPRGEGLARLLGEVLGGGVQGEGGRREAGEGREGELRPEAANMEAAFTALCGGLVDLSSMPRYQQEQQQEEEEDEDLPGWLLGLLACCRLGPAGSLGLAGGQRAGGEIQLAAISTLLELAGLQAVRPARARGSQAGEEGSATLVTMEPLVTAGQLDRVLLRTDTVARVAASLWAGLGASSCPATRLRCVSLLHRLLAHGPRPGLQVESVVAGSLHCRPGGSVEVYRRFALLWHLSRDLPPGQR
jgi:hypothetical protein